MSNVASFARVASLIGEPARAAILVALMDGRALTAGELARAAGIAPPTASGHLARLQEAGLLAPEAQGRHRYYRLAGPQVAATLEAVMSLSGTLDIEARTPRRVATGPRDAALRRARVCYDHLAGEVAVGIADAMAARGLLDFGQDGGALTVAGADFLAGLGVAPAPARGTARDRATFCRPCLDWSERRMHIGGAVGRGLYAAFTAQGWLRRSPDTRAVMVTPPGATALHRHFGLHAA